MLKIHMRKHIGQWACLDFYGNQPAVQSNIYLISNFISFRSIIEYKNVIETVADNNHIN